MATKEKFDGRSRPTNKVYEKRWDEIFGKKTKKFASSFGFFTKSFGFFMLMALAGP